MSQRDAPEPAASEPEAGDGSSGDRLLATFFEDASLWPILFVMVATFATFGAALVLLALKDRNLFALAWLAILVTASGVEVVGDLRQRRFGPVCRLIVSLWVLSSIGAGIAGWYGLF